MLAKDAGDRPASAAELLALLRAASRAGDARAPAAPKIATREVGGG